jgi:hypothetical protein
MSRLYNAAFLGFFLVLFTQNWYSFASPHHGVGSSVFSNSEQTYFLDRHKIRLEVSQSWRISTDFKNNPDQILELNGVKENKAKIQVHLSPVDKNANLESYSRKWIQSYNNYGLEVSGKKFFKLGEKKALSIDVFDPKTKSLARQVVQVQNGKAVVMSCTDEKSSFAKSLPLCNQIFRSFRWLD